MDLQQLRYFNVLAKFENMTQSAELLGISQSALSKNISKLEIELGYSLFDRKGKNIKLNKAGAVFLDYSKDAQFLIDEGIKNGLETQNGDTASIKIAVVGECNKLLKCIKDYSGIHPESNFLVDEYLGNAELPDINVYDIVICPEAKKYDVYQGSHLYDEAQFFAVNSKHPLANRVGIKAAELEGQNLVLIRQDKYVETTTWDPQLISTRFGKLFFVNTRALHSMCIAEGIASGIVSEGSLEYYKDKNIVILPITDKKFSISKKVAFKREKHLSNESKNFIKFFKTYFEQI